MNDSQMYKIRKRFYIPIDESIRDYRSEIPIISEGDYEIIPDED